MVDDGPIGGGTPSGPDEQPPVRGSDLWGFDSASMRRISEAVQRVEAEVYSGPGPRPGIKRQSPPTPDDFFWAILRAIPNPDGIHLVVEEAVRHPFYHGGPGHEEHLGVWTSLSEARTIVRQAEADEGAPPVEPTPPELIDVAVWPNMKARDFELFRWPVGAEATIKTEILTCVFRLGGWHVRPDFRPYLVETEGHVPVGSCHHWEDLEGLE